MQYDFMNTLNIEYTNYITKQKAQYQSMSRKASVHLRHFFNSKIIHVRHISHMELYVMIKNM